MNRFFYQVSFAITIITSLLSNYLCSSFPSSNKPLQRKSPLYINLIHSRQKIPLPWRHIPPPSFMQFPRFPRLRKTLSSIPSYTIHVFGTIQVLSSSIVLAILAFFIHYLAVETYYIPWTFILVNISPFSIFSPLFLLSPPTPCLPDTNLTTARQLLTVSSLSLLSLLFTYTLHYHYQGSLSPRINVWVNTALLMLWCLGLSLLVWNINHLLADKCSIMTWSSERGVMVCRLYKALTAFTIISL